MATCGFDISKKFVRVIAQRDNGLVEFEFSVGEPEMAVELIMPRSAFDYFCSLNQVTFLDSKRAAVNEWDWNLHDATHQRFR